MTAHLITADVMIAGNSATQATDSTTKTPPPPFPLPSMMAVMDVSALQKILRHHLWHHLRCKDSPFPSISDGTPSNTTIPSTAAPIPSLALISSLMTLPPSPMSMISRHSTKPLIHKDTAAPKFNFYASFDPSPTPTTKTENLLHIHPILSSTLNKLATNTER